MEFKHPKYYAELKKIREAWEKHQAASNKLPGPRPISKCNEGLIHKQQASSSKPQATSPEATSDKPQAPSKKPQA